MSDDNLHIWNKLKTTPPKYTKKVTGKGYKAKSVDPSYQLEKMTDVFGPCGSGWGYETEHDLAELPGMTVMAVVSVRLWYFNGDDRCEFGPVTSACILATPKVIKDSGGKKAFDDDGKPLIRYDDDALKKAETDALTKAMSRIGMSADVFAGLHDDNKYVSFMTGITGSEAAQRLLTAARSAKTKSQRDGIRQVAHDNFKNEAISADVYDEVMSILAGEATEA